MTGAELRAARKGLGLTQAAFGDRLGISAAFIGEMERGEKVVTSRTAKLVTQTSAQRRDIVEVTRAEFLANSDLGLRDLIWSRLGIA